MASHNDQGNLGEQLAKTYLEKKGYEILDENWRYEKAEIDLIALYEGKLIFIEVKTRGKKLFGNPEEFIDDYKEDRLKTGAEAFIEIVDFEGEVRFDIISIILKKGQLHEINHFEDVFY
jgi:putative endonuclease